MDELAKRVSQWIETHADKEWRYLIVDDEIIPDEDALINQALEDTLEWLADEMANHPKVQDAIYDARITVREAAEDAAAYERDPLGYVGMSVKDFI